MKNIIKYITLVGALFFGSTALADNVLIVGSYGDAGTSIKNELEAVGHTVTQVSSLPSDMSNIDQAWDLRVNSAISSADQITYDTFLGNGGYLYLAGENSSFATRNNSISAFTSTLGGGTISVGGSPNNAQTGNTSYFSEGTTVDFIAAAGIDNTGGTGRVLASDGNGIPTAMIWIGNAGDLDGAYTGTLVVVADINWTQSNYYDANNELFLEELIAGVVAGTVNGTISDSGTGTGVGASGPTLISINDQITTVYASSSNTPMGEEATKAIDGNTSNKYLNFDKETAGFTVKLSTGRVVKALEFTTANDFELRDPTKFSLYGSNDGVTWYPIVENADVTLPADRNTTIDPVTVENSTAYVYYFVTFPELKSTTDPSCVGQNWAEGSNEWQSCNSVQIAEVTFLMESGDTTTSTDLGSGSVANPSNTGEIPRSSITSVQQSTVATAFAITSGNNIDFTIIGNSNTVDIDQLSNGNYLLLYLNGNSNTLDIDQTGSNADRNFADVNIVGDSNNFTLLQQGNSNKTAFIDIDGSSGTFSITQQGAGEHFLDLTSNGNNAVVNVLQEGLGNHSAIVDLQTSGSGQWNFNLTQSSDVNQLYSTPNELSDNAVIGGTCTSGTCNLTVNQQ
jgi:hypothetical protein